MFSKKPISEIQSAVANFRPDVVGISIRNIDNLEMLSPVFFLHELSLIVGKIRAMTSIPIVLGGAALSVMPEEILRLASANCAVTGNGEYVFPLLLECFAKQKDYKNISGIAYIENNVFKCNPCLTTHFLNGNFAPDFNQWIDMKAYKTQMASAPIITKIGCMFQCIYCTDGGSSYRFIDPEIVADSVSLYVSSGIKDIEFADSVFNTPLKHAIDVCEALARNKKKARIQCLEINPLHFNDSLLTAMKYAGFSGIGITLESAADTVLNRLKKGFGTREVYKAVDIVKKHRIPCAWIFMLGGPGETEKTVKETLLFAEKYIRSKDLVFFNIGIRIFPGTELEIIARNEGILSSSPAKMLNPVYYISPNLKATWIEHQLKAALAKNMNFIGVNTINMPFLPTINKIGYRLGMRPPLWKFARFINRGLRFIGMN
jgi:radical SAM superfamily enzyme YgiQ (UPF0313 family)